MQLLNFTIIKLTLCLITGITIGYLTNISLNVSFCLTASLLAILFVIFLIARNQFIKSNWFGTTAFGLMIAIGVLTINLHNQKNFSSHYTHQVSKQKDTPKTITFRIREVLKSGNFYDKYIIDVLKINDKVSKGKSLLNIQKDTLQKTLKVDATFISKTVFKNLASPLNPNQFDYKSYLDKKYIYHQLFINNQSLLNGKSDTHTLFGLASTIRQYINKKLKLYRFKPNELAIINALLLGQKQDISKKVYTSYTNAGAVHILAVSGLHVGIILIILSLIFKPIEGLKYGKFIKTTLLVVFLWCFALIAGFSPSVTRSVTMFSIITIALNLKRPTNIYNTLAISMFVILLFKPLFLFDVGFQLSYLAVFAIITVDPFLYKKWKPKYWITDKLWHTFTITISAQLGIIPISLFYFHQFPSLFFISNLVIIPFLGIILGLGILIILLSIFNILPEFIANIYGGIISLMNAFVNWVSNQEFFLFKDISFSLVHVLVSYLLIISFFRLLIKRNYSTLKLFLVAILITQIAFVFKNYSKHSNEFIVFHKSRYSLLGNTSHNKITVANDFDSLTKVKDNIIKNYTIENHITHIKDGLFQSVYQINDKRLLVIDSLGIYNIKSFKPDYVLLRQSPKINLNRLIDSIKPKYIIADGSNYKSYIERWLTICKKRKLPFHQTSKKGAFIIKY
ncbi:competence protein [Flavivirga aquatica]|uniref:Competence protein n=1 Tax=Flavivirga aquatica TaxID=1849968 RepID=A0A1E5T7M6_9FLAO|nr:ComEC/Rec2 family competence protein [Flavivirga aquatica]OEK07379.1 competence protein [Flavivirga aquatica]